MDFPGLMMPPPPNAPAGGLLGGFQGIDPQKMGLLAAAFKGLQASGPSRTPMSLGQTIGQAGEAGMDAMRQGNQDQMRQAMFAQQQQAQQMAMAKHAEELRKAQQQQAALSARAAQLPEADRPAFMADPQGFESRNKPVNVGRTLMKPDGTVVGVDSTWQAEQQATREERTAAATAAREQRMQELQMRLADQRTSAAERMEFQREMRNLVMSQRQPPAPTVVQTDNGPMVMDRDGNARPIMGPDGPVKGKSTEKALPTSAAQKLMENQQNLRRAEEALALIQGKNVGTGMGDKNATGLKGYMPDAILQRMDPEGIDTRARIADLGSLVIHDRSGAAVTAAEFPRLRPFIPAATDDPETVKKKLGGFVREYRNAVGEAVDFYKESGYKVPDSALRGGETSGRTVVRQGKYQGKTVVEYSDGTLGYK